MYSSGSRTSYVSTVVEDIEHGLAYQRREKQHQYELRRKKECGLGKVKNKTKKDEEERERNPCEKLDDLFAALNMDGKKYADPFIAIRKKEKCERLCRKRNRICKGTKKEKIVNRDFLTRQQHIELLSRPRKQPGQEEEEPKRKRKCCRKKKKKKKRCKCNEFLEKQNEPSVLSPRMRQLAMPTKRLVYANWCSYKDVLGPDCIVRMENILTAGEGRNLEAKEAEKYFKKQDKKKTKVLKT